MANKVTIKNKKILGIHKTSTKGSVGTKYLKIPSIPTIPLPQINNFVFPKNYEKIGAINAAMALPMIIATNKNFDPTKLKVFPNIST